MLVCSEIEVDKAEQNIADNVHTVSNKLTSSMNHTGEMLQQWLNNNCQRIPDPSKIPDNNTKDLDINPAEIIEQILETLSKDKIPESLHERFSKIPIVKPDDYVQLQQNIIFCKDAQKLVKVEVHHGVKNLYYTGSKSYQEKKEFEELINHAQHMFATFFVPNIH